MPVTWKKSRQPGTPNVDLAIASGHLGEGLATSLGSGFCFYATLRELSVSCSIGTGLVFQFPMAEI